MAAATEVSYSWASSLFDEAIGGESVIVVQDIIVEEPIESGFARENTASECRQDARVVKPKPFFKAVWQDCAYCIGTDGSAFARAGGAAFVEVKCNA